MTLIALIAGAVCLIALWLDWRINLRRKRRA